MQIYIIVWGQHEALQQVKMNVVLKPRLIFNCLIIRRNRTVFAVSKLCTLFTSDKKLWQKLERKYFIAFLLKLVLSKTSVKQMTKTALALGLGKSTFTRTILRMDAQLHTKANHGILRNF